MRAITVRVADRPSVSILPAALRCDTQRIASYARVFADARYRDLIVDPMSACVGPVRAMIDAHDRLYGSGSGEAFLLGPYLDILPAVVVGQVKAPQR